MKSTCLTMTSQKTQGYFISIEQDLTVTNMDTFVLELMIDHVNKGLQ